MPDVPVFRRVRAVQYTGANSAEIVAMFQASYTNDGLGHTAQLASANSTECLVNEYDSGGNLLGTGQVLNGSWVILSMTEAGFLVQSNAQFTARWMLANEATGLLTGTPAFTAAIIGTASAFGSLPSITVPGPGNANFDVPIRPMQPANTFTAVPFLTGSSSLLGSLSITGLTSGTVTNANKLSTTINGVTWYDRVRVNVANSGALQLSGAALLVHVSP